MVAAGAGARYLVNAAGIIRLRPILESGVADMREIYPVNVEAVWDLTSRLGRQMPAGRRDRQPQLGLGEAGHHHRMRGLRVVQGRGAEHYPLVRLRLRPAGGPGERRCPGIIDTPMQHEVIDKVAAFRQTTAGEFSRARNASVPLGRPGSADECAGAIWFLLSDQAGYMKGQAVNFTGGQIMW